MRAQTDEGVDQAAEGKETFVAVIDGIQSDLEVVCPAGDIDCVIFDTVEMKGIQWARIGEWWGL